MIRHWAIALVLAAATPLYLSFTHNGEVISSFTDSVVYLLTARHYADPSAPLYGAIAAQSPYPPLYPLLLALTGGAGSVAPAHAATTVALLLAFVVLYCWLRRFAIAPLAGATIVLIIALLPGLYVGALLVMSENLYLLFSVLALMLLEPAPRSLRSFALAAACASAAALTRSVGILLFLPLALTAWRWPRRAHAFLFVALALVPIVLWSALHEPLVSYADALKVIYGGDPIGAAIMVLPSQARGLFQALTENIAGLGNGGAIAMTLVASMLAAAAFRGMRLRPDAIYVAAYLGVLLIWPYPTELPRLSLPILPVLLVQLVLCLSEVVIAQEHRRWLAGAALVASVLFLAPILFGNVARIRLASEANLPHARNNPYWFDEDNQRATQRVKINDATVASFQRMAGLVPDDDCVYVLRPALVTFYSGRRGVVPPLEEVDDDRFTRRLLEGECRYIVLHDSDSPHGTLKMFPSSRIKVELEGVDAGTVELPGQSEPAIIQILARIPRPQ